MKLLERGCLINMNFDKELKDKRMFFDLPTKNHNLEKIPRKEQPIERHYHINPRLYIKKEKLIELISNVNFEAKFDTMIETIGFETEKKRNEWLKLVRTPGTTENRVAWPVFHQTVIIILSDLKRVIELEEELKRQYKLRYLQKRHKNVILENDSKKNHT